jgi:hypothetical protein
MHTTSFDELQPCQFRSPHSLLSPSRLEYPGHERAKRHEEGAAKIEKERAKSSKVSKHRQHKEAESKKEKKSKHSKAAAAEEEV